MTGSDLIERLGTDFIQDFTTQKQFGHNMSVPMLGKTLQIDPTDTYAGTRHPTKIKK